MTVVVASISVFAFVILHVAYVITRSGENVFTIYNYVQSRDFDIAMKLNIICTYVPLYLAKVR